MSDYAFLFTTTAPQSSSLYPILDDYPLFDVTYKRVLNGVGSFSGWLSLADPKIQARDPISNTAPVFASVYIVRDGVPMWGGLVTKRDYGSDGESLQIHAETFQAYFKRRFIKSALTYTNADQLAIAQGLINYAQSQAGGNIGIVVPTNTSGILRSLTYAGTDNKIIGDEVDTLSKMLSGFDYDFDVLYSSGNYVRNFTLNYPRRGVAAPGTGLVFDFPGNIENYTYPEDGNLFATSLIGIGSGSGSSTLLSYQTDTTLTNSGWPLFEDTVSNKDIAVQANLDAYTSAWLKARKSPPVPMAIRVRPDLDPVLGSYTVGDECRVIINDARFPNGIDMFLRIIAQQVDLMKDSAESVILTLGPVFS